MLKYSIIIAAFSNPNLDGLLAEIRSFFKNDLYELIIVIDGSDIEVRPQPDVRCLRLHENYGKNYALFEGFKKAKGKWIVTLDDDGEQPVTELSKLIAHIEKHDLDVVIGTYKSHRSIESWIKHITEILLLGKPKSVRFTPLKIIHRSCLNLHKFEERVPFISTLLCYSTKKIGCVTIEKGLQKSPSSFTFKKRMNFYLQLIASRFPKWGKMLGIRRKKVRFKFGELKG